MNRADTDALRARLLDLQHEALAQLVAAVPVIDTGLLRFLADLRATLAVLDDVVQRSPARVSCASAGSAWRLRDIQTPGGGSKSLPPPLPPALLGSRR